MARKAENSVGSDRNGGMAQLVVAVVFATFAVLAVGLRVISRRLSRVHLRVNDYMIIFALVQQLCFFQNKTQCSLRPAFYVVRHWRDHYKSVSRSPLTSVIANSGRRHRRWSWTTPGTFVRSTGCYVLEGMFFILLYIY